MYLFEDLIGRPKRFFLGGSSLDLNASPFRGQILSSWMPVVENQSGGGGGVSWVGLSKIHTR